MRYLSALSLAVISFLAPCASWAAQANDDIANATALSSTSTLNRIRGNFKGVTADNITILLPGATVPTAYYLLPAVWFKWTAPVAGKVYVEGVAVGATIWGVAVSGPLGQDVYPVVGYDPVSTIYANGNSVMSYDFDVTAGVTYFAAIETSSVQSNNAYTYVQRFQQNALSDSFASATQMGGNSFTIYGDNGQATKEDGEPDHSANPVLSTDKSIWTKWQSADARKAVSVKVTSRIFSPIIAVYTGDAFANLQLVARSTNSTSQDGKVGTVNFVAEDGVEYYFAVDGSEGKSGAYTFEFKASDARPGFLVQPLATTIEQNQTAVITTTVAYTGDTVAYQWERLPAGSKTWVALSDDQTFNGTQTATLTIGATLDMNNDQYRVKATDSVGTSTSRAVLLTVTEFPFVSTEVLGTVNVSLVGTSLTPPSNNGTYFATGLPKGLTLDPATGAITGVVTAKPGVYRVVYGTTDGKKKNPGTYIVQITVAPFSTYLTGAFEALLVSPTPAAIPQGKVSLKVTTTGSYTGTYFSLAEGKSYSFRGVLDLNQANRSAGNPASAPLKISRGKTLPVLSLDINLTEPVTAEADSVTTLTATLVDPSDTIVAWSNDGAPVSRFTATNLAPWAGRYTVSLSGGTFVPSPSTTTTPSIPLGSGYATATITDKTGVISLRGYLADDTLFTASLASSPSASYLLAQRVYGPGGSLAGQIKLTAETGPDSTTLSYHANALSGGSLFWAKPALPKSKLYPAGFDSGSVKVTPLVQPWVNPVANFPGSLGLTSQGDMKVRIVAAVPQDGNDSNVYGLPVDVRISSTGTLSFVSPATNTTKFAVKFDAASGVFTGSYELAEANPLPRTKARKVTFKGVLLQFSGVSLGDTIGAGYAIVPPLDAGEVTSAALLEFLAGPPQSPFGLDSGL